MVSKGFKLSITKMNQQRQTIVVTFCMSESMALIIPNAANVFTKVNPSTGIAVHINKELKRTKFDGIFCKKFQLLINRFSSYFH